MVDAIRKDAAEDKDSKTVVDLNDPTQHFSRADAMKAMTQRRRETVAEEMTPEDYQALTGEVVNTDEEQGLEVDPKKQLEVQTRAVPDADLDTLTVKIKVNGEERTVPLAKVIESAQINEAGRQFLADSKRIYEDALAQKAAWEKAQQEAAAKQHALAAPPEAKPATPAVSQEEMTAKVREAVKAGVQKMFAGDDEGAVVSLVDGIMGALPQTAAQAPAPAIDINAIATQVTQKVTIDGALRQFAKDFADIVGDPNHSRVADRQLFIATDGKSLEQIPPDTIPEVLERAGKMTRAWFGLPDTKPVNGTPATTREVKNARKEQIDELPAAATRASTSVPVPLTASEQIQKMKQARGQGVRDPTQR